MEYPVVCGQLLIEGRKAVARLADHDVTVSAPPGVLRDLFRLCDGRTPLREVRRRLGLRWRSQDVGGLFRELVRQGLITDADLLAFRNWRHVENPRRLGPEPAAEVAALLPALASRNAKKTLPGQYRKAPRFRLRSVLDARSSARVFSGRPVSLAGILGMLWAAYGVQSRRGRSAQLGKTVPSGGAIYPLRVALVSIMATAGLKAGAYALHFRRDGALGFRPLPVAWRRIYRAFEDPGCLRNAHGAIIVGAEVDLAARKYGNRATLYASLEAGHAVQNALLAATELAVGAVEIGGFIEDELRRFLPASSGMLPLSTIVFGTEARARQLNIRSLPDSIAAFRWVDLDDGQSAPPFFLGMAQRQDARGGAGYCWGCSRDPLEAYDKTMAEALERSVCSSPTGLYQAAYADLDRALDPREVAAYQARQYRMPGFPFAPFRTASRRWWKDGRDRLSGRKIAVPAELVYFGGSVRALLRRPCSAATSSGVAAFADRESALERAVLELLERDAFMRAWLGRARTPRIPPRSLPGPARRRVSALNRLGLRVVVKILASDPVPVLMVFTQHPQRAFTVVGTAADYDWEKALDHALMECESTSIMRLQHGDVRRLEPSEVRFPEDHGDLYAQPRYFRGADFLARDGAEPSPRKAGAARSWKGLLEELRRRSLRLISVDLSPPGAAPGDAPLYVVRAIVPGLVPLSFGFGTEPLGIPEVQALLRRPNGPPLLPHPLA